MMAKASFGRLGQPTSTKLAVGIRLFLVLGLLAALAVCVSATPNPLVWYSMDSTSGTTVYDDYGSKDASTTGTVTFVPGSLGRSMFVTAGVNGIITPAILPAAGISWSMEFITNATSYAAHSVFFRNYPAGTLGDFLSFDASGNAERYDFGDSTTGSCTNASSQFTAGQSWHVVMEGDGVNMYVFRNGTMICQVAENMLLLNRGDGTTIGYSGDSNFGYNKYINNFILWNGTLTYEQVQFRYNNGAGRNDTLLSGGSPPIASTYLVAVASDLWTGSSIADFNISVSNASDTITNTTASGSALVGGLANLTYYNVTFSSGAYFNSTQLVFANLSTGASFQPFQVYLVLNATQLFTNVSAEGFNVSVNGSRSNQTAGSVIIYELPANVNLTLNASAAFYRNLSTTINFTPLTNTTLFLRFYNSLVNVSLHDLITNRSLEGFSVNVSPTNFSESLSYSTSGNTVFVPALKGYNFSFTPYKYTWDTFEDNASIGAASELNVTLYGQLYNSVYIEIFDESLNQRFWPYTALQNETVQIEFIGPNIFNVSTSNGTLFLSNVTTGDYELRYFADSFDKRSYFFNLPGNGSAYLQLYLLNKSISTLVVVTVADEQDDPLNGSIVKVQRLFPSSGVYKVVEMSRADFNGEAPINIVLDTQEYRFMVDLPLGNNIFNSQTEAKITSTTLKIVPKLTPSTLAFSSKLNDIQSSISGTQNVGNITFVYSYSDIRGLVATGCLEVRNGRINGSELLCSQCVDSSAATLTCNVNVSSGEVTASGLINTTNPHQLVDKVLSVVVSSSFETFGTYGAYLALILFIGVGMTALWNPAPAIVISGLALVASFFMGIFVVSIYSLIGLIISGIIIVVKSR